MSVKGKSVDLFDADTSFDSTHFSDVVDCILMILSLESHLEFFLKLPLLFLLCLDLLLVQLLLTDWLYLFGDLVRYFSIIIFFFLCNLLVRVISYCLFLLFLDDNLFSKRDESINWNFELLVQFNLHLFASSYPFLCLDYSRMIVSVGVGRQNGLTVPLLLIITSLSFIIIKHSLNSLRIILLC